MEKLIKNEVTILPAPAGMRVIYNLEDGEQSLPVLYLKFAHRVYSETPADPDVEIYPITPDDLMEGCTSDDNHVKYFNRYEYPADYNYPSIL